MGKFKGFSLVELLAVVVLVALMLLVLLPGRSAAREAARQRLCMANLFSISQAVALYQSEYNERNPRVGTRQTGPGDVAWFGSDSYPPTNAHHPRIKHQFLRLDWLNTNNWQKYSSTVPGSLYLLVRTQNVAPDMFICPSDRRADLMILQDIADASYAAANPDSDNPPQSWEDLKDFHNRANLSYGYNDPFSKPLSSGTGPDSPVLADTSVKWWTIDGSHRATNEDNAEPIWNDLAARALPVPFDSIFDPDFPAGAKWDDDNGNNRSPGNSPCHDFRLQHVAYADGRVARHDTPLAGIAGDNIYTYWTSSSVDNPTPGTRALGLWNTTSRSTMFAGKSKLQDTYIGI